jgi:PAS domain S-box-containing protein
MDDTCAQLAAIIADADDAIISRTLDGTITSWNHAAERLYGYPAAEMLGRTFDLSLPNGEPATQLVTSPDFGARPIQFETTRRRADGSMVDVAIALSPIRDEDGNVTGFASITRDISERKRLEAERQVAEAALRESEERFRSTFEWSPIGMALVGLDGRWLNVNPALCRIVATPRMSCST